MSNKLVKVKNDMRKLRFKDFGLDGELNFLQAPLCECGCGGRCDLVAEKEEDIVDEMADLLLDDECCYCAIFIVTRKKEVIIVGKDAGVVMASKTPIRMNTIGDIVKDNNLHKYGVLVEVEPCTFKIIME